MAFMKASLDIDAVLFGNASDLPFSRPAPQRFNALQVWIERLRIESFVICDVLRAVRVESPWQRKLIGVFDSFFEESLRVGEGTAIDELIPLILHFDAIGLWPNQHRALRPFNQ